MAHGPVRAARGLSIDATPGTGSTHGAYRLIPHDRGGLAMEPKNGVRFLPTTHHSPLPPLPSPPSPPCAISPPTRRDGQPRSAEKFCLKVSAGAAASGGGSSASGDASSIQVLLNPHASVSHGRRERLVGARSTPRRTKGSTHGASEHVYTPPTQPPPPPPPPPPPICLHAACPLAGAMSSGASSTHKQG